MAYPWAQSEIERLLHAAIADLESSAGVGKLNSLLARHVGKVAGLLDFGGVMHRASALLSTQTAADLFKGSLTNIDLSTIDISKLRGIESPAEFSIQHPVWDDDALRAELTRCAESTPHLQLCLQGDPAGAVRAAKCDIDFEEIGNTLAVLGKLDDAITFIDSQPVQPMYRKAVRFIVLLEKCRRSDPAAVDEINRFDPKEWYRLPIILALANRRPWIGYPYSDY
jgi:hypothetical protein